MKKKIDYNPEWVLEKLPQISHADGKGNITICSDSVLDSYRIFLALETIEIEYESVTVAYDADPKEQGFEIQWEFKIEDIKEECPSLYNSLVGLKITPLIKNISKKKILKKEDFLKEKTNCVIEVFEKRGGYPRSFTVLYENGSTVTHTISYGMSLDESNYLMRRHCEKQGAIACVFISETCPAEIVQVENDHSTECMDIEKGLIMIYTTRDNIEELHAFKSNQGKLELDEVFTELIDEFCNPFKPEFE